jgi:hypothetical protein
MGTKPISTMNKNYYLNGFLYVLIFVVSFIASTSWAGEHKTLQDSGIVGEKKTLEMRNITQDPVTGITFQRHKHGSFVVPIVMDGRAYFNLNYRYAFYLRCMDWSYQLKAYWFKGEVGKEREGFSVKLVSPSKKVSIIVSQIDIFLTGALATTPSQEHHLILGKQTYAEDPLTEMEMRPAGEQAITWFLRNLDGYTLPDTEVPTFTMENINNQDFVRAEVNVTTLKNGSQRRVLLWALPSRGFRLQGEESMRRMYAWVCVVLAETEEYGGAVALARMIPETLDWEPAKKLFSK